MQLLKNRRDDGPIFDELDDIWQFSSLIWGSGVCLNLDRQTFTVAGCTLPVEPESIQPIVLLLSSDLMVADDVSFDAGNNSDVANYAMLQPDLLGYRFQINDGVTLKSEWAMGVDSLSWPRGLEYVSVAATISAEHDPLKSIRKPTERVTSESELLSSSPGATFFEYLEFNSKLMMNEVVLSDG